MDLHVHLGERIASKGRTLTVTERDISTLRTMRPHLVEVARTSSTTTYSNVIDANDLPYRTQGLGRVLDLLSEDCFRRGEPSLAALVIAKATGEVGDAFEGDPVGERELLYAYWTRH